MPDELIGTLPDFHDAVGTSPRSWVEARISVPAESLSQACTTAVWVVESATGNAGDRVREVMAEDEFEAPETFTV